MIAQRPSRIPRAGRLRQFRQGHARAPFLLSVVAGSAQQVTLTSATTTDTSQVLVVTKPIYKTLVSATTTEAAQTLVVTKPIYKTLTSATTTDVAQALSVTHPIRVTLTAATATDTAQALTYAQASDFTLTPATTTDVAQLLAVSVGQQFVRATVAVDIDGVVGADLTVAGVLDGSLTFTAVV